MRPGDSTVTYTYAILRISRAAYAEIRAALADAGYEHAFHEDDDGERIDMHGIAVQADPEDAEAPGA